MARTPSGPYRRARPAAAAAPPAAAAAAFVTHGGPIQLGEYLFHVPHAGEQSALLDGAIDKLKNVFWGKQVARAARSRGSYEEYRTAILARGEDVVAAAVFTVETARHGQTLVLVHIAHERNILGALLVAKLKCLAQEKGHKITFAQSAYHDDHLSFHHKCGFSPLDSGPMPKTSLKLTPLVTSLIDPSVYFHELYQWVEHYIRLPHSVQMAALLNKESCDQELARWVALSSHEALTAARNAWCIEVATMVRDHQSAASGPRDDVEASGSKTQRL